VAVAATTVHLAAEAATAAMFERHFEMKEKKGLDITDVTRDLRQYTLDYDGNQRREWCSQSA